MTKWKNLFLIQSMVGRDTELSEREAVIDAAIKLAYRDMLTVGRFCLYKDIKDDKEKESKMETNCRELKSLLRKRKYIFNREIFENSEILKMIFNTNDYYDKNGVKATRYGLAQKFVNMTFKYLYVFSCFTELEDNTFGKCDCPIDSVILNRLKDYKEAKKYSLKELEDIDFNKCKWSKIKGDDYIKCQNAIEKILPSKYDELKDQFNQQGIQDGQEIIDELKGIGNLAFDFIEWGDLSNLSMVVNKLE